MPPLPFGKQLYCAFPIVNLEASFEETPEMFLKAARHGELDMMRGVSANVMCGQEGYYGTSAFQVLLDLEKMNGMDVFVPEEKDVDLEMTLNKCDGIKIHNNISHRNYIDLYCQTDSMSSSINLQNEILYILNDMEKPGKK